MGFRTSDPQEMCVMGQSTEMSPLVSMLFWTFLNPLKFLMELFLNMLVILVSSPDLAVNCGDPGTPTNGQRSLSSTTYNSVVTYTCDEATHCRDQTVELASRVNSGVEVFLSATVSSLLH